jgi:predicted Rdx family selenoprotein
MSVTETLNTPEMAFYVPSCNTIYAWARQQDGEWVTEYGAKTLNAVRRIYLDTELLSFSGEGSTKQGLSPSVGGDFEARYIDQLEFFRRWTGAGDLAGSRSSRANLRAAM